MQLGRGQLDRQGSGRAGASCAPASTTAWTSVSEHAHGQANLAGRLEARGGRSWSFEGEDPNPYQVEHDDLFRAVREDIPYNESEVGAKSTLTAILGRMATYSGKTVTWEEALNSQVALVPSAYAWGADPPSLPDADGRYPIPTPGVTHVF